MVKNIIFDIGQVLVNYDWRGYIRSLGYEGETAERIGRAMFAAPDWNELDRGVLSTEEVVERFVRNDPAIERELRDAFRRSGETISEREYAVSWVREMKERGFRVYYLSNYSDYIYQGSRHILEKFLREMDGGVFSWKVQMIKPDEGIYRRLLETYGLKAEECVFMDDNPANVETAKRLGIQGIVFTGYEETRQKLEEMLRA